MLTPHFCSYLYFVDDDVDKLIKRFVRDRVRYVDDEYCHANTIIQHIHQQQQQRKQQPQQEDINRFVAYHIRRGDFQHKQTQLTAATIVSNTRHLLPSANLSHLTLYIAIDETTEGEMIVIVWITLLLL